MRCGKRETLFSRLTLLFILLFAGIGNAQTLPIGGWRTHLPYQKCKSVTGSNSSIWAATDNGLFKLNKSDNTLERITKIDGLSDLSIGRIAFNPYNNILFVGYENGNIDLIEGTTITNISDIKRASIIGSKTINNIYFIGDLAYVSTGFGIVVVDTHRKEIKDTYLIGQNGTYVDVHDITSDGTTFFVATATGIYYAPVNSQFLSNFTSWTKFTTLPGGFSNSTFNTIEFFHGKLFANHDLPSSSSYMVDRFFEFDIASSTWSYFTPFDSLENIHDIFVQGNTAYFCSRYQVFPMDTNFAASRNISYYPYNIIAGLYSPASPQQVYVDQSGTVWTADLLYALVRMNDMGNGTSFAPNGPISTNNYLMASSNQQLLVVPGGHDDAWNNVLNHDGISTLKNGWWTNYGKYQIPEIDTSYDLLAAAIDPADPDHYFLGSWGWGLLEIRNGVFDTVWNNHNSSLLSNSVYQWVGIAGIQYDTSGNLWVVNSHVSSCLSVFKKDRTWQSFNFGALVPDQTYMGKIMVTSTGQKWMVLARGGGILVFDDHGTLSNTTDDSKIKLGFSAGIGGIPGTDVYAMAEDQDGEIWIGTDKGIGVFYCAENIFSPGACDAQQILITQGSYVQILLETQVVTAICVDGANRKWIGTEGGGVFLMSPDGQKELAHFTADNSPLLSDDITSMTIDKETGEVFFGTTKGIISYMGEAIDGGEKMGDVYAFPNPVNHEYHGPIAITGLTQNADVKITDIRGDVVFTTTALGGRAIWDGNNFQGVRASSGVYVVFVSNADGTQKAVTKILLIN
jgi:hypothetical protein